MLKRLASHAVSAFEKEVASGIRQPLSADELADTDESHQVESSSKATSKKGKIAGVKQAKIVRLAERVDGLTGKGKSKGYGFVEMRSHADALRVLRWSNNNSDLGHLWQSWWKEELESLIKQLAEKRQKDDEDETRLKKLKDELQKFSGADGEKMGKGKGTLIVEFSIENVQVVQRRAAHQESSVSCSLNNASLLV
jgi:nucleolar protein 4